MAIDRIEFMSFDTLPPAPTGEVQDQLDKLKHLALHPVDFRLMYFHLPADIRQQAKYALTSFLQRDYEVQTLNIPDFTQELIAAIRADAWDSIRKYSEAEVLIIDGLQYIACKEATQAKFYASVLKPRLEKKRLTVLFSEKRYSELSSAMREDLYNLIKLGFHDEDC